MRHYVLVLLWSIFVLILCVMPPGDVPFSQAGTGMDKLAHAGFFFVFSVLLIRALSSSATTKRPPISVAIIVFITGILFALFTEFLQWKIFTYRTAEVGDLVADVAGIGMALFAYFLLKPRFIG